MALKRVKYLYVDEDGRFIADIEGGETVTIGLTDADFGKPGGVPQLGNNGAIKGANVSSTMANPLFGLAIRAGLRLLSTQKSDGGWQWNNPDTDPSTGMPTPANTVGITAQGILDCYGKMKISRFLSPCISAYDAILLNSTNTNPSKHRVRGPDLPFLVGLSETLSIDKYADFAKTRWASAVAEFGGGSAAGFAAYIRDARKAQGYPAVISWDINLYMDGVLALDRYYPNEGYEEQAEAMAGVVYNSLYVPPVDFDIEDDTQAEYWIGITGAIEAFISAAIHETERDALIAKLLGGQQDDGHFIGVNGGSDVQTTAYAVLALLHAGRERAASAAVNYLIATQMDNGGWSYGETENTEVASEASHAVFQFLYNEIPANG